MSFLAIGIMLIHEFLKNLGFLLNKRRKKKKKYFDSQKSQHVKKSHSEIASDRKESIFA